jgi:GAF domain
VATPRRRPNLIVTASSGVHVGALQVSLTDEHSGAAAAYHARTASFVADVPHHAVPSQRLAAAVDAASALYQPITHQDVTFGVLAIAWKQRQARLPAAIRHAVELLAQTAAPFLHEHQTPHEEQ